MKTPFVSKELVERIAKDIPTPFHIYDEKGIRENAKRLLKAFSWNKGFKEYFAVKATPNPYILKILQEEGCGTDCSSYTELIMSDVCGFHGHDIMFSSNVTPAQDFALADKLGVIINLDDFSHIDFLEKTIGHIPETICCRYNPGGLFKIKNQIMDTPSEAKYGFTHDQLIEGYKVLIKFINLSGGVGVNYRPDQEPNDIIAIGEGVRQAFEEIMVPNGLGDCAIFTELGRYMLAPYGHLITKVTHEKQTYKDYIGVDACACNLMRPAMYGAYHHITVLGKENAPCDHKYDVTGGLCENNDKFAIDRMLPKIDIGDYIAIHDTGAHGFSMGYNYNGKLRSAEVLLKEDGTYQLIRRAETPEDYFRTFDFSKDFDFNKEY